MVGNPKNEKTFMGALISKEHLAKVKGYVDIAEKEGATIACGKEELNLEDSIKNVDCHILCHFLNYKVMYISYAFFFFFFLQNSLENKS